MGQIKARPEKLFSGSKSSRGRPQLDPQNNLYIPW